MCTDRVYMALDIRPAAGGASRGGAGNIQARGFNHLTPSARELIVAPDCLFHHHRRRRAKHDQLAFSSGGQVCHKSLRVLICVSRRRTRGDIRQQGTRRRKAVEDPRGSCCTPVDCYCTSYIWFSCGGLGLHLAARGKCQLHPTQHRQHESYVPDK